MRRFNLSSLALLSMLPLVSLGCCGPLACGPVGCDGPVAVARPACGGCGDCQGCGELYIDPWINEPPRCDPCDSCGNYNGQTCGSCRPVFSGLATLWGYRYDGGCGGCGSCGTACDSGPVGCDSCGMESGCSCGGHSVGGGHVIDGAPIHGGSIHGGSIIYGQPHAEPLPVPEPTPIDEATDSEVESALMDSHIPNRSQQIFRRRGTVVQRPTSNRLSR